MGIREFGKTADGEVVREYMIDNGILQLSVLDFGGTVTHLRYQGREMILGYDDPQEYLLRNNCYQGAFVGRYANRIGNGAFTLGDKTYTLAKNNNGRAHLHGGTVGFNRYLHTVTATEHSVTLHRISPDGEEGYPGNLEYTVTYTLCGSEVAIDYRAESDADTIVNLTNHCYYNLGAADILSHVLTVNADAITPVDEALIPTGELMSVEGTPFDLRDGVAIGKAVSQEHPQLALGGGGIDHNFVLGEAGEMKHAATLYCPESGIIMECHTTEPGVQVYTSNTLCEQAGRDGVALHRYQGVCLETQHFPDTPNKPQFPSCVLEAGERFESRTVYRFGTTHRVG